MDHSSQHITSSDAEPKVDTESESTGRHHGFINSLFTFKLLLRAQHSALSKDEENYPDQREINIAYNTFTDSMIAEIMGSAKLSANETPDLDAHWLTAELGSFDLLHYLGAVHSTIMKPIVRAPNKLWETLSAGILKQNPHLTEETLEQGKILQKLPVSTQSELRDDDRKTLEDHTKFEEAIKGLLVKMARDCFDAYAYHLHMSNDLMLDFLLELIGIADQQKSSFFEGGVVASGVCDQLREMKEKFTEFTSSTSEESFIDPSELLQGGRYIRMVLEVVRRVAGHRLKNKGEDHLQNVVQLMLSGDGGKAEEVAGIDVCFLYMVTLAVTNDMEIKKREEKNESIMRLPK